MQNELEPKQVPCKATQEPGTALVHALCNSGRQISWIIIRQLPFSHFSFLTRTTTTTSKPKPAVRSTGITQTRASFPAKKKKISTETVPQKDIPCYPREKPKPRASTISQIVCPGTLMDMLPWTCEHLFALHIVLPKASGNSAESCNITSTRFYGETLKGKQVCKRWQLALGAVAWTVSIPGRRGSYSRHSKHLHTIQNFQLGHTYNLKNPGNTWSFSPSETQGGWSHQPLW